MLTLPIVPYILAHMNSMSRVSIKALKACCCGCLDTCVYVRFSLCILSLSQPLWGKVSCRFAGKVDTPVQKPSPTYVYFHCCASIIVLPFVCLHFLSHQDLSPIILRTFAPFYLMSCPFLSVLLLTFTHTFQLANLSGPHCNKSCREGMKEDRILEHQWKD